VKVLRYLGHASAAIVGFEHMTLDIGPAEQSRSSEPVTAVNKPGAAIDHADADRVQHPNLLYGSGNICHHVFLDVAARTRDLDIGEGKV
jgi:hypothetical protein